MVVFAIAKAPACVVAMTAREFERRRNLWLALTLVVFLAHNFWVYIIASGILLFLAARRDPNRFALFFMLLLGLPTLEAEIRGVGPIRTLFTIDGYRLLSLTLLLPAYLYLRRQPEVERFGRSLPDKLILIHMVIFFVLKAKADGVSVTDALRQGVFYSFIEIFLPYYVASRSLRTLQEFRGVLTAFMVGALVVGTIGVFEWAKGWLLYGGLDELMGTKRSLIYAGREGSIRAVVTFGLAIPFGYVMAVATGIFLYVSRLVLTPTASFLGWLVVLAGLVAGLSRGPWVGAAVMLFVFVLTSASALSAVAKLSAVGLLSLPMLALPVKDKLLLDYVPFIGTIQSRNIDYRWQLLEAGAEVVMRNPWFGTFDALSHPEMLAMRQGQGIIDVVNSYLELALERGLVGLAVFVAFFVVVIAGILRSMKSLPEKRDERHVLGQALLATLLGILVMIVTVSSVLIIPWIYWSLAGVGVAYARMIAVEAHDVAKSPAVPPRTASATR